MRKRVPAIRGVSCLLIAAVCLFCVRTLADESPKTVYVVANASVKFKNLETNTLRAIFSMRMRQWPDGEPIQVFILPDRHPVHLLFTKKILKVFPFVLRDQWDRLTFTGTGRPPTMVESEEELVKRVKETPGAVGYTSKPNGSIVNLISISESRQYSSNSQIALSPTFVGNTQ